MAQEELKKIVDKLSEQGKMNFLEAAKEEDINIFEKENDITFPDQYKQWLEFSDGGECFLPAGVQFYGVKHKPTINVDEDDRPNDNYIVIGTLASGDPIIFEKGKQCVSIYNHADNRIEDDETYEDFFSFLNDLYDLLGIGA